MPFGKNSADTFGMHIHPKWTRGAAQRIRMQLTKVGSLPTSCQPLLNDPPLPWWPLGTASCRLAWACWAHQLALWLHWLRLLSTPDLQVDQAAYGEPEVAVTVMTLLSSLPHTSRDLSWVIYKLQRCHLCNLSHHGHKTMQPFQKPELSIGDP